MYFMFNYDILVLSNEKMEYASYDILEKNELVNIRTFDCFLVPQNYVKVTDETVLKGLQRTLDLLDEDDDVQAVYHNWEEE